MVSTNNAANATTKKNEQVPSAAPQEPKKQVPAADSSKKQVQKKEQPPADVPATKKEQQPSTEQPPADAAATTEGGSAEEEANGKFASLQEKLSVALTALKDMTVMVKGLQKEHAKLLKSSQKKQKRSNNAGANGAKRTPSGFAKPAQLSPELAKFLGYPEGTQLARTDVTRQLNTYIKNNNLQDKVDKRTINPDPALRAILNLKDGDKVTYFNLQSHIKHHFVK